MQAGVADPKDHTASWGDDVPGLYGCPDGRWRIIDTDREFTEPDERRAVARLLDFDSSKGAYAAIPKRRTATASPARPRSGRKRLML